MFCVGRAASLPSAGVAAERRVRNHHDPTDDCLGRLRPAKPAEGKLAARPTRQAGSSPHGLVPTRTVHSGGRVIRGDIELFAIASISTYISLAMLPRLRTCSGDRTPAHESFMETANIVAVRLPRPRPPRPPPATAPPATAPPATAPPDDPSRWFYYSTPQEIGPYRIVRCLGSGGMSKVYLGQHGDTGKEVAIKVLRPDLIARSNAVQRFEVEFHAARKLDHPNMVRAYDFFADAALVYLVLEFIDGPSVAQMLREKTGFSEARRRFAAMKQTAGALERRPPRQSSSCTATSSWATSSSHPATRPSSCRPRSRQGSPREEGADPVEGQSRHALQAKRLRASYENARRADHRSDLYSLGVTLYQPAHRLDSCSVGGQAHRPQEQARQPLRQAPRSDPGVEPGNR